MNELLYVLAEIIAGVIALVLVALAPKLKAWLVNAVGVAEAERLDSLIVMLVKTAQQLLWEKSGEERKEFVLSKLQDFGYEFTDYINNKIEETVFDIHK